MTYQHRITHYRPETDDARKTSYAIVLLIFIFICSSAIAYYSTEMTNVIITVMSLILVAVTFALIIKQHRVPFVTIADGTLNYFDAGTCAVVTVPTSDITHIHTRFCELIIHTPGNIHTLNLSLVRNAKTRWEIKEMIREVAVRG